MLTSAKNGDRTFEHLVQCVSTHLLNHLIVFCLKEICKPGFFVLDKIDMVSIVYLLDCKGGNRPGVGVLRNFKNLVAMLWRPVILFRLPIQKNRVV